LLTNDDDFIPFCRAIKEFGANISLIHLSDVVPGNASLLREVDSYDVVPVNALQTIFLPVPEGAPPIDVALPEDSSVSALKADAVPSDLAVDAPSAASEPLEEDDVPSPTG